MLQKGRVTEMKRYIRSAIQKDIDILTALAKRDLPPDIKDSVRQDLLSYGDDTEVVFYFDAVSFDGYQKYCDACSEVNSMLNEVLPKCGYWLKNDVYFERDSTIAIRADALIDDVLIPKEDIEKIKSAILHGMDELGYSVIDDRVMVYATGYENT